MPKLSQLIESQVSRLKDRVEGAAQADLAHRVLPPDFQAEILEGCAAERAAVLARIEVIDESLQRLDRMARTVKAERAGLVAPIHQPDRVRYSLDGSAIVTPGRARGRGKVTAESIERGKVLAKMRRHRRALETERVLRESELGDIRRLEAATRRGVVTALVAITSGWRSKIMLGKVGAEVRLARVYSDPAGNPLPPAALDAEGRPLALPTVREARR